MKIAIFDVSHWHFPLYIPALSDPGVEVVGISDSEAFSGERFAQRLNCKLFDSNEALLEADFDFALVFSRHSRMAGMAKRLIDRGIPFLIEKPCGLNLQEVRRIRQLAERRCVHVSVPFINRVSDWASHLSPSEGFSPEGFQHLSFRFIVGLAGRYERNGNSWMLDKRQAGGGSLLNVGIHFIDLISSLTGALITHVSAQARTFRSDVTVDEQAILTCRNAAGQIGLIETGYLYPSTAEDQRDFAFSISHTSAYARAYADQLYVKARDQKPGRSTTVEFNTDEYYPVFLRRSWADLAEGRAPVAGLREAEHAIAVLEAAYRSAAEGGTPQTVERAT
ncbi:hypothetical protein ASG72_19615 [Bosea sp. Leaf344]|uniref:Gfo/Idh/MocA family protein n=1 Tax=Bosea sp. Leaf344 TaxID=1736346 RepID=UPI000701DA7D|nr:Gfo/Idh/MocA family oxidoreductase [Bosea sp. Leaf344]KQU50242.1 hypothetical protein ASG72_19615 [Bosea sp. Leaf344]